MEQMNKQPYERIIFVCANQRIRAKPPASTAAPASIRSSSRSTRSPRTSRAPRLRSLCLGLCEKGPNICIMPENVWYTGVTAKDLDEIKAKWIDPMAEKKPS
jgi:(2Fe-2S) ferredoxin